MDLATFKILIDVVMFFIRLFSKGGQNEEKLQAFQEVMHDRGMESVQLRLGAQAQLDEIDEAWKKEIEEKNDI